MYQAFTVIANNALIVIAMPFATDMNYALEDPLYYMLLLVNNGCFFGTWAGQYQKETVGQ